MVYSQSSILALGLWLCTASAQAQVGMTGEAPVGESVSPVDGVSSDGEKASDAEGDTSVVVERREVIQKCIEAHENAQLENLESHLLKQREWLLRCAELECPGSIRLDCSSWLESNQRETPSIQILVRDQYGASLEAVATIDSIGPVPIESTIELNPGSYRVAIAANGRHYERRVSLVARERGRLISFTIVDAKEEEQATGASSYRPIPVGVWILGGSSLAFAALATGFGVAALDAQQSAEAECAPFCSDETVSSINTTATMSDISWVLAASSLVGAVSWYLLRPTVEPSGKPSVSVDISPRWGGISLQGALQF